MHILHEFMTGQQYSAHEKHDRFTFKIISAAVIGFALAVIGFCAITDVFAQAPSQTAEEWRAALVSHIQKFKKYPDESKKRGEYGLTVASFEIDRKGKLLRSKLIKRTCFDDLNDETIAMLKRAEPFPPVPETLKRERMNFSVPMRYSIGVVRPNELPIDQRAIDACFTP